MPSPKPTHDEIVQAHINDLQAKINGLESKIQRMLQIIISGEKRQRELELQLQEVTR